MDQLTPQNPNSIQQMFGAIAGKYDLANTVLSMGIHHSWKRALVRQSGIKPGDSILDCATGTGDLAFRFEAALQSAGSRSSEGARGSGSSEGARGSGSSEGARGSDGSEGARGSGSSEISQGLQGSVVGSDFCEPMLEVARIKAAKQGSKVSFVAADAMNLPFEDSKFDIASISFGIRNVKDAAQGLSELGRVVKPGGRVLVLEFGQPQSRIMAGLFGFYSSWVLPRLGGWISGESAAYGYLQTSSATFPCGEGFLDLARSTGRFSRVEYRTFQYGIAFLYCLER